MSRRIKQIFIGMALAFLLVAVVPVSQVVAYAANAKISFSDPSVMVNNDVTVTMKITSTGGAALGSSDVMVSYDPAMLKFISGANASGGAGSVRLLGTMDSDNQTVFNFAMKFKALKAGTTKLTVASQEIYDINSQMVTLDKKGDSTVKIAPLATYSKDATLKSLKIDPGTLTPQFSSSVESYTASVGGDVTRLVVSAVASNAGANVVTQGDKDLKPGENKVVCKVTAEDGKTVKNYTITVTKAQGGAGDGAQTPAGSGETKFGDLKATIDGKEYAIATSFGAALPEGFEATTYQYKGTPVMAGKGIQKDLLLLYLSDEGGNKDFYIYNEGSDSWTPYVSLQAPARSIVILPLDKGVNPPKGMSPCVISLKEGDTGVDKKANGWVWESDAGSTDLQYCIFYGMNADGKKGFYRYDKQEHTVQRLFQDQVSKEEYRSLGTTYNNLRSDYNMQFIIIIVLIAICVILFVILILILLRKGGDGGRKGRGRPKRESSATDDDYYIEEDENQEEAEDDAARRAAPGPTQALDPRVKRYSREEMYMRGEERGGEAAHKAPARRTGSTVVDASDSFDDDFMEIGSLDDMEQTLASRESRTGRRGKAPGQQQGKPQEEDDDFESLDLF